MGRWQPDARGRLEAAALQLFSDQGFDRTTAAEVAARAGLAERTFFRHFADKREVLFRGSEQLQAFLVQQVADAPASTGPLDAVGGALAASGPIFREPGYVQARQRVIAANAELQERELIKLARLAGALTDALRRRGVTDPAAGLAAEVGIAVFKVAFGRWVDSDGERDFTDLVRDSLEQLKAVTAGR